jgi:magnesium and cobalt transporter
MSETSDGREAIGPHMSEDEDPDSPARASFFSRLFRRDGEDEEPLSEPTEESRAALAGAREMLLNLRKMRRMRVDDVSVPRADIVAVGEDATLEEVVAVFQSSTVSRLPVYSDTLDQPLGLVHLKDLALKYGFGRGDAAGFKLSDHIRTALFVPPSMRIAALLQRMQGGRVHMALVIDEFGGVDGIVTIEDLVEQIVGDIEDEHDIDAVDPWTKEADGVYLVNARADIREFEEAEGVRLLPVEWEEDVDTLGGLLFMLTNRVPARGEVITHPMGHEFEVVDADARKVKRLRLAVGRALAVPSGAVGQAAE